VTTLRRCAVYTRKSSEEGLEQAFNSLHAQREACEAYIKSQASTELTRRWLSWELQAQARGGFDATTSRRLRQLCKAFRADPPSTTLPDSGPRPGSMLTREWNGVTHRVMVLEEGFAWNGQKHDSLSDIAFRITGTRWSGPRFFGLRQHRKS